jgi:hypothetical protein
MSNRQMLNQILDYMARNPDNPPLQPDVIAKNAGLNIDKNSAYLLCDQLYADKHVSRDGDYYIVLLKGINFSKRGGYPRFSVSWGTMPEWIVAVTTTLLAVLATIEFLRKCK